MRPWSTAAGKRGWQQRDAVRIDGARCYSYRFSLMTSTRRGEEEATDPMALYEDENRQAEIPAVARWIVSVSEEDPDWLVPVGGL